jgi:tetratricopeptide (TPR) repeat protein
MYCTNCGNNANSGDLYCAQCGKELRAVEAKGGTVIANERMKKVIEDLSERRYILTFTPAEIEEVVNVAVATRDARLAESILVWREFSSENILTPKESDPLIRLILSSEDVDVACSVLLRFSISKLFTKDEISTLQNIAFTTHNEWLAYHIYRTCCFALNKNQKAREALREIIVNTRNPETALAFLLAKDDNSESYKDDLKSLDFSQKEIERFKRLIIDSHNAEYAWRLLASEKLNEYAMEKWKEDSGGYMSYDEIPSIVELTQGERAALKNNIINSKDANVAMVALRDIGDFTVAEKTALKDAMVQTNEPYLACAFICDPDIVQSFDKEEYARLRRIALGGTKSWNARTLLEKIHDLTAAERVALEKIAAQK